jgi:integrase
MSVHKTKKGIWFSKWYEKTPEGFKEKRRYFAKDHEQDARDWDAQRKLDEAARQNHELTLVELAQEYFEARADELHPLTRKSMVNYITGAAASFAQKPCEAITRRDLQTLRKNLANVKPATRNEAQTYITAILNWGVTQELIYRNPWVGAPKLREEKYLVTATIDDFRKILEHAAPHLVWAVDVSLSLALRPGYKELLSLKWDRFRWQYGYVEVNQGKGGGLKTVYPPEAFLVRAHARFITDQAKSIPWVMHFRG